MQFIYCELNAFIFLKSLQLFLSELSFNHFQITKYQLCSNLLCISENKHVYYCVTDCTMCYQNNVTCHANPPKKICYQNGKKNFTQRKRKSKTQTSLLKEIFKSHIDWLIFFPILGQILGNKTLEK